MSNNKLDGGYGVTGNYAMLCFLESLTNENRALYEKHLKKDDVGKYNEFKEWEKWIRI